MLNLNPHILVEIFLRTLLMYALVLLGIRITGKREVGQLTPFDLVFLLLIANAVQNAMTGPDTSLTGGFVAAGTLFVATLFMSKLFFKNRKYRQFFEGTPTVLVARGQPVQANLLKECVTMDELNEALREHGVLNLEEVELAVLEIDGSVSVIRVEDFKEGAKFRMHRGFRFLKGKS